MSGLPPAKPGPASGPFLPRSAEKSLAPGLPKAEIICKDYFMDILITIAGLAIGISVFLYFIQALDKGKRIATAKTAAPVLQRTESPTQPSVSESERNMDAPALKNLSDDLKDRIPHRICPLCSHILTRDEPLYATHIEAGGERKILIYGCPYCYKSEKKTNARKDS